MSMSRADSITGVMSFVHPRYDSVATCLWWIFAAVSADPLHTTGIVVLPRLPGAIWWPMTAKLRLLTVLPSSCVGVLEMRGIRGWSDMPAKHDLCLFMFPVLELKPRQYGWEEHYREGSFRGETTGHTIVSGGEFVVRKWIYVLHTKQQHLSRSAEEPQSPE